MNKSQEFDVSQILNAIYRRKDIAIATFFVVLALAVYLAMILPNVYRSSTLILVTSQRLPSNYVAPTVTSAIEQRMQAAAQQILGRTILETIIHEFNLFPVETSPVGIDGQVEKLRKRIMLTINRNDTFALSFDAETPDRAMQVTSRLASLFIETNLKARAQQAAGTRSFINTETDRLRKELEEQEVEVNKFKAQYRFELPEQLDANLRVLDQYRRELESGLLRLSSVQERKAALEKQMVESDLLEGELLMLGGIGGGRSGQTSAMGAVRNRELEALLRQYSEKHPDVVRLKREIQAAEAVVPAQEPKKSESPSNKTAISVKTIVASQIEDFKAEIAAIQTKNNNLRSQISLLQTRVENTSLRAIDQSKITRNYDITLRKYQDLLAKGLESELSENMERKQKGELFQIVDPANFPQQPVAPNRPRVLLIGLLLALGGGVGVAFLLDNLDTSIKTNDDFESFANVTLLGVLPAMVTRGLLLEQRRARAMLVLFSFGALAAGLVLIRSFGALLPLR